MSEEASEAAADLFKALASPIRLQILQELGPGPRCVHELVDALGHSQALVSQHLRTLRQARIVQGERRGKEIAYSIADRHIEHIVADARRHVTEEPI